MARSNAGPPRSKADDGRWAARAPYLFGAIAPHQTLMAGQQLARRVSLTMVVESAVPGPSRVPVIASAVSGNDSVLWRSTRFTAPRRISVFPARFPFSSFVALDVTDRYVTLTPSFCINPSNWSNV